MSGITPIQVIPDRSRPLLVIIGVGGTGGYVLQQVARLLYSLQTQRGRNQTPSVLLVDGDTVEQKNLLRQYFLPQDVGRKKAEVLAERYSRAYGLDIHAYSEYIDKKTDLQDLLMIVGDHNDTPVVVGCVDNSATRLVLHTKLQKLRDVVYIDSGNDAVSIPDNPDHLNRYQLDTIRNTGWEGQVCVGVRSDGEDKMPFPGEVFPDLIIGEDKLPTEISCGEEVVSNPQRLMTNLMAATTILVYLHTILVDKTLLHHRSFFDSRKGYIRSEKAIDHVLEVRI